MTIDEFKSLKQEIAMLTRKEGNLEGVMEQLLTRIKSEFDCNSLEEAEKLINKERKKVEKEKERFASSLQEFKSFVESNDV